MHVDLAASLASLALSLPGNLRDETRPFFLDFRIQKERISTLIIRFLAHTKVVGKLLSNGAQYIVWIFERDLQFGGDRSRFLHRTVILKKRVTKSMVPLAMRILSITLLRKIICHFDCFFETQFILWDPIGFSRGLFKLWDRLLFILSDCWPHS